MSHLPDDLFFIFPNSEPSHCCTDRKGTQRSRRSNNNGYGSKRLSPTHALSPVGLLTLKTSLKKEIWAVALKKPTWSLDHQA